MMTLHQNTCTAAPLPRIKLPACPQCGDMLLAPLLAEHVSPQHVRNHWVCEDCGHSFRKSFVVEARIDDELYV
jgi:RNase P subunit RPR2